MSDVFPALVDAAIKESDCIQAVYSNCVKLWYRSTGKFNVGFTNKKWWCGLN